MSDQKKAVMESMFGVFNKPAETVKFKQEEETSGGMFFNPDPKNAPNQTFMAVVKFLPNLHNMENMTVTKVTYWVPEGADLKGGFRYDSPKSLGKYEKCIVADKYWELKESDDARQKAKAKKLSYSKKTFALIQVIKDLQKPENNGKIMVWELPVAIQKKIDSIMYPSKEEVDLGAVANNVFDPANGQVMTLKIGVKTVTENGKTSEYRDYDDCKFMDKLPTTMLVPGQEKQMVLSSDAAELQKQQEEMLELILAGPNLQDYAYKALTEDGLVRVQKALANLSGVVFEENAPASESQPAAENQPAENSSAPAENAPEAPAETKAEAPAQNAASTTESQSAAADEDDALLKDLGLN